MNIMWIFATVTFSSPLSILIIALHTVFLMAFTSKDLALDFSVAEICIYWLVSCSLSLLTFNWLRIPLSRCKSQRLVVLVLLSFVLIESFLLVAHFISGAALDFALIYYNFNEIFVPEALISVFLSGQSRIGLLLLSFLGLGMWVIHRQFSLFSLQPVTSTISLMIINAVF